MFGERLFAFAVLPRWRTGVVTRCASTFPNSMSIESEAWKQMSESLAEECRIAGVCDAEMSVADRLRDVAKNSADALVRAEAEIMLESLI